MVWRNIIALFLSFFVLVLRPHAGGIDGRFVSIWNFFSTQVKIGPSVPVVYVECRGDGCFRPAKSARARAVCA